MMSKFSKQYRLTVEPIFFAVFFVTACTGGVTIDVIERNVYCADDSVSNCDSWNHITKSHLDNRLSRYLNSETAKINMIIRLVQGSFPFLISMFVGPWTDKNGRKPFMILALGGYTIYNMLWAILSLFHRMPAFWYILPSVPLSFSGGQLVLHTCCNCYISDISQPDNRMIRFSMKLSSSLLGNVGGNCFVILMEKCMKSKDLSYLAVFCSCAVVTSLALIYALLFIEETVVNDKKEMDFIFNFDFAKSIATNLFEKPAKEILIILLSIFIMFFDLNIRKGERVTLYLVGLNQFAWSLSYYNMFSAVIVLISAVSSLAGALLLRKLGWANLYIIALSSLVSVATQILRAMSISEWQFWITSAANTMVCLTNPAITSEISTLAGKDDFGKIYALSSLTESLVPFVSTSLYSELYRVLVNNYHHTLYIYILSALFSAIIASSALILICLNYSKKDSLKEPQSVNIEPVAVIPIECRDQSI